MATENSATRSSHTVYTALNVPTHASFPSSACLQWSPDGQVILCTKSAVYILTPEDGLSLDTALAVRTPVAKDNIWMTNATNLAWYMTMIELGKGITYQWPAECQDWEVLSAGSLDISMRAVTCSPSNLTAGAGCALAILNSNFELSLWASTKNHLRGEWTKSADITAFLRDHYVSYQSPPSEKTLGAQITCISWSKQTDFGLSPAPPLDGSLLAAGNRAGAVILLRSELGSRAKSPVFHAASLQISDKPVTHAAWTSWQNGAPNVCRAFLACAASGGFVVVIEVVQSLAGAELTVDVKHHNPDVPLVKADNRVITAMAWIENDSGQFLVICKAGVVIIWPFTARSDLVPQVFRLSTQKLSVGSSALSWASGIIYDPIHDSAIVSLFDGSFHVIRNISTEPFLSSSSIDTAPSTQRLSSISRGVFLDTEAIHYDADLEDSARKPRFTDVNRMAGMISYDDWSSVVWLQELARPTDFSYKHDAKHQSVFVVAKMWRGTDVHEDDLLVAKAIRDVLVRSKAVWGYAPIHLLRPILFQLREMERLMRMSSTIRDILRDCQLEGTSEIHLAAPITEDLRDWFRISLTSHFFGSDTMLHWRLGFSVADFCWKLLATVPEQQAHVGNVAQSLLTCISHNILHILVRHLQASIPLLDAGSRPFVMRVILQSSLPGSSPALLLDAKNLADSLSDVAGDTTSSAVDVNERCPACHAEVKLEDPIYALCPNGHFWPRCTITYFILSTPAVRTCCGCGRKAFLPATHGNSHLPIPARTWVVQELLEATRRCIYCGNSYISLV